MSDVAELGFAIDSSQAVKATGELDKLSASADRLQGATNKTGTASKGLASDQKSLGNEAQRAAAQFSNATPIHERHTESIRTQRMQIRALAEAFGNTGSEMSALINKSGLLYLATNHISVAVVAAVVTFGAVALAVRSAVAAYSELESAQVKVANALNATSGASGQSAKSFEELVRGIAHAGTQSIADVRAAATEMLKFRAIGGDTFGQALKDAADAAATGFADLKTSAAALGKSLADPIRAGSEFEGVGLRLSVSQQRLATDLYNTGRIADAQRLILKAWEEQVGGGNAKSADTLSAAYGRLKESATPLLEKLGEQIAKAISLKEAMDAVSHSIDEAANRQKFFGPGGALNQFGRSIVARAEGRTPRPALSGGTLTGADTGADALDAMTAKYKADAAAQNEIAERIAKVTGALKEQGRTAGMTALQQQIYAEQVKAGVAAIEGLDTAEKAADRTRIASLITRNATLDWMRQATDQIKQQTGVMAIESATIGMAIGPATAYRVLQEKILDAKLKGYAPGAALLEQLRKEAEAEGKVADVLERVKVLNEIKFERATMFLSDTDVQIAQKLKGLYGNDIPSALASSEAAAMRVNAALKQVNDLGGAFVSSFVTDLSHGVKAIDALKNSLTRLSDTLIDMASRRLWQAALGSFFGGGLTLGNAGGTAGNLTPIHHAGGMVGSPGMPTRYVHPSYFDNAPRFGTGGIVGGEVPIVAHKGEEVGWPAQLAAKYGGAGGANVSINYTIDARGADQGAAQRIEAQLAQHKRELPGIIVNTIQDAKRRSVKV